MALEQKWQNRFATTAVRTETFLSMSSESLNDSGRQGGVKRDNNNYMKKTTGETYYLVEGND